MNIKYITKHRKDGITVQGLHSRQLVESDDTYRVFEQLYEAGLVAA